MKLAIATGQSRMEKKWKGQEITYEDFIRRVSQTHRTAETQQAYLTMPKGKQDEIKDVGGFVLGRLEGEKRRKDSVISRSAVTLDMDYGAVDSIDQLELFHDMKCVVYSTHKHTPEKPRLRLIIFLTREVTPDEYGAVARRLAADIGMEYFDDSTYEPSRLMYWPSTSVDGAFIFQEIDGAVVNPDVILASYKDWKDVSSWPVSQRVQKLVTHELTKQADPLEKEGIIGAFNRTFTMTQAIDTFLSAVYKPSAMAGRYDYVPADSAAGVVVYEDRFVYSHHATDPAYGLLLSAFDVVRIHQFGHLDSQAQADTASSKLPSFKAMQTFVTTLDAVKCTLITERKEMAQQEFEAVEGENWQVNLTLDKQGRIKDTLSNIALIIKFDAHLQSIVYNQFKSCVDVIGKLPWVQVKKGWSDSDLACTKLYFERTYGIWSPQKFKDALLAVLSSERLYHPIKVYFDTLVWDGVPRLDTLLIDYLGAEDTEYVRAVTRKTLVAAVARIKQPGIKFDSILVLNGPQGVGKSTLFALLGKEWYSDSLSLADMKDKTAAEKLQGYWILELGELAGIKKMDVETVKSFVSRTDDKFRQSYGINVESHPRSCIIVGTTNSEGGFLRDITGNRRFWPVHVGGKSPYQVWDLQGVDQIWAEAIERYRTGETLFLSGEVATEAKTYQQAAMESDDREGIVAEYLDKLLPLGWEKMDLYQRRTFLGEQAFEKAEQVGTERRERCCVMEIWCECFGKERSNLKKTESYEIETILNKLGNWKKYAGNESGKMRVAGYGVQKVFIRVAQDEAGKHAEVLPMEPENR